MKTIYDKMPIEKLKKEAGKYIKIGFIALAIGLLIFGAGLGMVASVSGALLIILALKQKKVLGKLFAKYLIIGIILLILGQIEFLVTLANLPSS